MRSLNQSYFLMLKSRHVSWFNMSQRHSLQQTNQRFGCPNPRERDPPVKEQKTELLNMTICSWQINYKWESSTATLNYQRVGFLIFILPNAAGLPGLQRKVAGRGSADVQRPLEQGDRSDFARDFPSGKLT